MMVCLCLLAVISILAAVPLKSEPGLRGKGSVEKRY